MDIRTATTPTRLDPAEHSEWCRPTACQPTTRGIEWNHVSRRLWEGVPTANWEWRLGVTLARHSVVDVSGAYADDPTVTLSLEYDGLGENRWEDAEALSLSFDDAEALAEALTAAVARGRAAHS